MFDESNSRRVDIYTMRHFRFADGRANWRGGYGESGFTMTELITIMVILGILAAVAVPRFVDNETFQNRAAADQAKAVFRYAQKTAIASHSTVTVNLSNGAQNCSTAVVAGVISCVLPNSVELSGATSLGFDLMGRPVPNAAASAVVGGTTITIEAETGYVR
jgi:MSHA pilin protein MshC